MTNVLLLLSMPGSIQQQYCDRLRASFPGLSINVVDHHSKVAPYIADAEVLVTFGPMMADHVLCDAPRLKWIQALGTGVDNLIDLPSLRPGVIVTNIHGIHGSSLSEAALLAMLALSRNLPRAVRNQQQRLWQRWPARLLDGKTAGILGIGAIAQDLAPRCRALGMRVVGFSSAPRALAAFDQMYSRHELLQFAGQLDFLVVLTPYSAATRHIVNANVLAAMKRAAYLINLARGGVVDEDALLAALKDGRLAGAALDVFSQEPLPPDHPFWSMENVIITPHLGGFYDEYADRALPIVEENLRRFLAGDTKNMINVVRAAG